VLGELDAVKMPDEISRVGVVVGDAASGRECRVVDTTKTPEEFAAVAWAKDLM